MTRGRGDYTGFNPQYDPGQDITWWPAERNVREPVGVHPQQSPEPGEQGGAYGYLPSRPAQVQVVTFRHDQRPLGSDEFVVDWFGPPPRAWYPVGRQTPFGARVNIPRPPAVAYGSLFQAASRYPYAGAEAFPTALEPAGFYAYQGG